MANHKLPISAVIVTYDESQVLERCLKSIYKLVDEIIIVCDGKPNDNTLQIAKKYTKKVYIKKHSGYCEIHRPFSFKVAKNDWLLMPDSDEYLSKELQKNLKKLINSDVSIYDFLWPGYDNGKFYNNAYKRTLFRKSKVYYFSYMNQNVLPINESVKIKKLNYKIWHLPKNDRFNIYYFIRRYQFLSDINSKQLAGMEKITYWNCKSPKWEERNKLRIKYPIILGIFGSIAFHFSVGVYKFFTKSEFFYLKQGIFTSFYCLLVFGKLALLRYAPLLTNAHRRDSKARP